jgi:hypothetical protein
MVFTSILSVSLNFRPACSAGSQSLSSMAWAVSRLSQQPPQPWLQAFLQALQEDEALVRALCLALCPSAPRRHCGSRALVLHLNIVAEVLAAAMVWEYAW